MSDRKSFRGEIAKTYSVRKMGTRAGMPHYGAECGICRHVLIVAHASKESATAVARKHVIDAHPTRSAG